MADTIALPRPKAKRKRRKPPSPWLIFAIVCLCLGCFYLFAHLVHIINGKGEAWDGIGMAIDVLIIHQWYGIFLAELKKHRRDDDE